MAASPVHSCCSGPAQGAPGKGPALARPLDPPERLPAIDYERHPGAATAALPDGYRRHEPEKTFLYTVVREHLETFLARPWLDGGPGYPRFIEEEFRRYLDCGLLSWGFSRIRCPRCGLERLVAYSCKGRLCPSCAARRTNDTAARLVDHLLPAVPYRQWVLSFCRAGMRQCRPRQGWHRGRPVRPAFLAGPRPAALWQDGQHLPWGLLRLAAPARPAPTRRWPC
jgi:hypothetical protein